MKTDRRFRNIINSDRPVIVDFYTEWCNPCKQVPVLLKEIKSETRCSIRIVKVDVDKNPSIASCFNVQNVPTLIVFRNGMPLWTSIGLPCSLELKEIFNQLSETVD